MRKSKTLKWITVFIIVVAVISLLFGSVIMLIGGNTTVPTASEVAETQVDTEADPTGAIGN